MTFLIKKLYHSCPKMQKGIRDIHIKRYKKELEIRKKNSTWAAGTSSALCICQQGPTVFLATFRLPAKNEIWQDVYVRQSLV